MSVLGDCAMILIKSLTARLKCDACSRQRAGGARLQSIRISQRVNKLQSVVRRSEGWPDFRACSERRRGRGAERGLEGFSVADAARSFADHAPIDSAAHGPPRLRLPRDEAEVNM